MPLEETVRKLAAAHGKAGSPRVVGLSPGSGHCAEAAPFAAMIVDQRRVCAMFLIANTMNTMVVEQGNEIASLRALGGRRRQVASVVLRTAAALGAAGATAGAALGIVVASLLTRHLGAQLFSVPVGFAVSAPVVVGSLRAGPILAVLASLPGLRRAVHRPVAEASNFIAQLSIRSPHFLKLDTPDPYDASCTRHPARTRGSDAFEEQARH